MNAAIDVGNTSIKIGFFDGKELKSIHEKVEEKEAIALLTTHRPKKIALSIVGKTNPAWIDYLKTIAQTIILEGKMPLPIRNKYATPETLGTDRIAAVIGARALFPEGALLVIDLGTCITYDFLTSHNEYLGGAISPGMTMRFKAMHLFTARLPLGEPTEHLPLVGNSTLSCLQAGVIHGITFEINGMIEAYCSQLEKFTVILCGGDAKFFETKIKYPNFVASNLVLYGLNALLL
ncbi:MAG: type III pantothenate kinase [Flammeovirgaceae bacterium]|nr:type III pantothenate kinase [Flammeovirgaceae bacterium]MDW8286554.1 type III pantothenate kinase [Flammeovirgaceae bacterium]